MALLEEDNNQSEQGFSKRIDEAGLGIVMDNLQKGQYSKPVESTIREVASNAVDSHRERNAALEILSGKAQVSDYYVDRDGAAYEASKFNPAYYKPEWLSDRKSILIEYFEIEEEGKRDILRITDFGVGLGDYRLEGYFSLSYSTKRLNKSALGKFGIGGKAPLSTGVNSFIMRSNYNGQHYEFEIGLRRIFNLVPAFNENDEPNMLHKFSHENGDEEYYSTPTTEKNGVQIEVEVKRVQRDAYKEAVLSQLMYFDSVEFVIHHGIYDSNDLINTSWSQTIPVAAQVFYESGNFLISRNNRYTRPHVIIGQPGAMVNYGLIDFGELEIAPRLGNVGIILDGSKANITPSREAIIWDAVTRAQVLEKFELALQEANEVVTKQLEEPDFLSWINKSTSLLSPNGTNEILKQLSGLIDKTQIVSSYPLDRSIKYDTFGKMTGNSFEYAKMREVQRSGRYYKGKYRFDVSRKEVNSFANVDTNRFYFTTKEADKRKDLYIQEIAGGTFYLLTFPQLDDKWWAEEEGATYLLNSRIKHYTKEEMDSPAFKSGDLFKDPVAGYFPSHEESLGEAESAIKTRKANYEKAQKFYELSKQSALYHDYDEVVVPDDWTIDIYEQQEVDDELANQAGLPAGSIVSDKYDYAKRRKEQGKIIFKYAGFHRDKNTYRSNIEFQWKQQEELASTLNSFQGTLVFATQPDKDEMAKYAAQEQDFDADQLADGTYPMKTVYRGLDQADTDENLLKVISGLLSGNLSNVSQLPNENSKHQGDNISPFLNWAEDYAFYPDRGNSSRDLILIKVSKPLAKKLTDFIPVREFLLQFDEKTNKVTTHAKIMNWYTAKRIAQIIYSLPFLNNFKLISPYHAKEYEYLYNLVRKHNIFDENIAKSTVNYPDDLHMQVVKSFDDLADFQMYVREGHTDEEIAEYAKEKLASNISDATIIDMDIYNRAVALQEWAAPIVDMMNNMPYFVKSERIRVKMAIADSYGSAKVDEQLRTKEQEEFLDKVRDYLRLKSVDIKELPQEEVVVVDTDEEEEDFEEEY